MTVYINNTSVRIFAGARLIDVVRRYLIKMSMPHDSNAIKGIITTDRFGNVTDLSAPCRHNQRFSLQQKETQTD